MKKYFLFLFCIITSFAFAQNDSAKKGRAYITLNAGLTVPYEGFGSTYYYVYPDNLSTYAGFAGIGPMATLQGGLNIHKGWEITGMFSWYHNPLDGNGYIIENAEWFLNGNSTSANYSVLNVYDVYTNNKYYYNNYSLLAGITKNWGHKKVSAGISLMFGAYFVNLPAVNSSITANIQRTSNGMNAGDTVGNYNFNIQKYETAAFLIAFNAHMDINLQHNFFIRVLAGTGFSGLYYNLAQFTITDMKGNTFWTSSFPQDAHNKGDAIHAGTADFTVGIGYKF